MRSRPQVDGLSFHRAACTSESRTFTPSATRTYVVLEPRTEQNFVTTQTQTDRARCSHDVVTSRHEMHALSPVFAPRERHHMSLVIFLPTTSVVQREPCVRLISFERNDCRPTYYHDHRMQKCAFSAAVRAHCKRMQASTAPCSLSSWPGLSFHRRLSVSLQVF